MDKVYVDVLAVFSREGELIPKAFVWEDGHRYMKLIKFQNRKDVRAGKLVVPVIGILVWWKVRYAISHMKKMINGLWNENKRFQKDALKQGSL